MAASWIDRDWERKWKFPKPVPKGMRSLYRYAESIRKHHPYIWSLGGNIQGNDSYLRLQRIVIRGRFIESDRPFIKTWQAWMARHSNHTRINGMVASLKWLAIPEVGLKAMKQIINDKIKKVR